MKTAHTVCLIASLVASLSAPALLAQSPKNLGVTFNGKKAETLEPLATDVWHTITASYRHTGKVPVLTNTYLVICRGSNQLSGFYLGYNLPAKELAIVKHGFWNATEATGTPGEKGKVIENDQGFMDCESTTVATTADEVVVTYRVKFKPGVMTGTYTVFQYIEDKDINYAGFENVAAIAIDREAETVRRDMPKQWRNSLKPSGKRATLTLAKAGKTGYTLVIPEQAQDRERKAAADLARYFKLISGAEFPVVSEDQRPAATGPYLSIGRTKLLAGSRAAWKDADLAVEGYAIEVLGKNAYLYGGSGRGLLHGVYSLLEEDLGCRWYSPTSIDAPKLTTFKVTLTSRRVLPALELRDPYTYRVHDTNWSLRNKTNTPHARIPLAWGGSLRYYNMGHTYAGYFPTQQYFAEHPEYYALVNGKRQATQLCHTNEDVIRLSIAKTCAIFRDHPEVTITAIGPNDGRGFCDCPNCKQLDDENGGRAGSFFYFVNRIAEGTKKEFPNNHLISLAYLDYAKPPTKLRVDPYIIIQLCTDSHAWKYQFCTVQESTEFQGLLKAWRALDACIYMWDYTTDYVHYLVPMANWAVVAENTRFFVQNGVRGIMYEAEATDMDELRGWVWAKQLWNPELDTQALLKDFVFGYFKESAPPLWEYETMLWDYWQTWHKVPHTCGQPSAHPLLNNLQCSYAPDGPMFTPEFMATMRRCFTQAEQLAASPDIRARVGKAKAALLYLELCQNLGYYTEFGDFVYGKSIRLPRAEKEPYRQLLNEFTAIVKANEMSTFGIPITLEKITTKWQSSIDLESAALPRIDLPAEWIFKTDPDDKGLAEKWYADPATYAAAVRKTAEFGGGAAAVAPLAAGLTRLHINRGVGWEQQGFPGFAGYGWYFQSIEVPADLLGKAHLYLYFLGVNEQAWVYVNGELACERTYASTGKAAGDLWTTPFSVDIKKLVKPGVRTTIAVRVAHSSGLGGIWLPAMAFGTDEECTTEQLDKYRH
jgi:hypothetical protein